MDSGQDKALPTGTKLAFPTGAKLPPIPPKDLKTTVHVNTNVVNNESYLTILYWCNGNADVPVARAFKLEDGRIKSEDLNTLPESVKQNEEVRKYWIEIQEVRPEPESQFMGGVPKKKVTFKKPYSSKKPKKVILNKKPQEGEKIALPDGKERVVRKVNGIMCVRIDRNDVPISNFCIISRSRN